MYLKTILLNQSNILSYKSSQLIGSLNGMKKIITFSWNSKEIPLIEDGLKNADIYYELVAQKRYSVIGVEDEVVEFYVNDDDEVKAIEIIHNIGDRVQPIGIVHSFNLGYFILLLLFIISLVLNFYRC